MKNVICFVGLVCMAGSFFACQSGGAGHHQDAPIELETDRNALYDEFIQQPQPADQEVVNNNPPALRWPPVRGMEGVTYTVQLSRDPGFSSSETIHAAGIPWAFYQPINILSEGSWFWKYKADAPDTTGQWSETYTFRIDPAARTRKITSIERVLKAIPAQHPRILLPASDMDAFRQRVKAVPEYPELLKRADAFVGKPLPDLTTFYPTSLVTNSPQDPTIINYHIRRLAFGRRDAVMALSQAYIASNDPRYGYEAVRWILPVLDWDKDGLSAVDDFMDGGLLSAMAIVYDSCHDLLTASQKKQLLDNISYRANRFYLHYVNHAESRVIENHLWQHIFRYLLQASIATLGETENAGTWLEYLYNLWLARFPVQSETDGGWTEGNYYMGVNFETLVYVPHLFSRYSGTDFFAHPWYENVLDYLLYTMPPKSYSDGFSDGHEVNETPRRNRVGFSHILGSLLQDPKGTWYADENLKGSGTLLSDNREMQWIRLLLTVQGVTPPEPVLPADLPKAKVFRDVGVSAWHTHLDHTPKNLMISFRSGPFGAFGHSHADQNAFNINYGGIPLFVSSGYYSSFADKHTLLSYRHTRAANSILVNGLGQAIGVEGYGWIARHLDGNHIRYVLGDASNAYQPVQSGFIKKRFAIAGITADEKNGFGDAGLKRFRRHLIFLDPDIIVVYDELEAAHPAKWSWLLHSPYPIRQTDGQWLYGESPAAKGQVHVFGSTALHTRVTDQFFEDAVNWVGKTRKDPFFSERILPPGQFIHPAEEEQYPPQWHAEISSAEKVGAMRFLAIIQVRDRAGDTAALVPQSNGNGSFTIGRWTISAELDAAKEPYIDLFNQEHSAALVYNRESVKVKNNTHQIPKGSTVIWDQSQGSGSPLIAVDAAPPAKQTYFNAKQITE